MACVPPHDDDAERYKRRCQVYASLNRPLREKTITDRVCKTFIEFLKAYEVYRNCYARGVLAEWINSCVENEDIGWASVQSVDKTGIKETGYDLTVPGYETFMSLDGVILSNTVNLHVPAGQDAVDEAYNTLLPSKMIWSPREYDKSMAIPKHEAILGLRTAQLRPAKGKHVFATEAEALKAIENGRVKLTDEVVIQGAKTP